MFIKIMEKKEFKPVVFKAKIKGEEKTFEIITPKFIVPGLGVMTAEEASENAEALAYMVENNVGSIREIEKEVKSKT